MNLTMSKTVLDYSVFKNHQKTPMYGLQHLREFQARQMALKSGIAIDSALPAGQSPMIDAIDSTVNKLTSNDALVSN